MESYVLQGSIASAPHTLCGPDFGIKPHLCVAPDFGIKYMHVCISDVPKSSYLNLPACTANFTMYFHVSVLWMLL